MPILSNATIYRHRLVWNVDWMYAIHSLQCYDLYVFLFCDHLVQHDLLKGDEDAEFIEKLCKKITMPMLILWGDHDRVSTYY